MKHFTKMVGGVVAVAVLAAPSMASAHSDPSVSSVKAHVRNADEALTMVADRVKANDNAAAAIAMVQNLRQTQAAPAKHAVYRVAPRRPRRCGSSPISATTTSSCSPRSSTTPAITRRPPWPRH